MYFVEEEGITTVFVVGGAATLEGAKELASNRAKSPVPLIWKPVENRLEAVVNYGLYCITYRIEQGER